MTKLLMICLLVAAAASPAIAQIDDAGRWGVGLEYGAWKLIGGDHDYSTYEDFGAFHLRHGLSPAVSLDLGLKFGSFRPGATELNEDVGFSSDASAALHTRVWQPALSVVYHIVPTGHLRPWVSGGLGLTSWELLDTSNQDGIGLWPDGEATQVFDKDGASVEGKDKNLTALLGIGLDYAFNDHFSMGVAVRTNVLFGQDRDNIGLAGDPRVFDQEAFDDGDLSTGWGPDHVDANNQIIEATFGLRYMFGGAAMAPVAPVAPAPLPPAPKPVTPPPPAAPAAPADRDHDGILDNVDKCPDTPEDKDGFEDADGCPDPDNDGDGVLDAADKCPTTPKGVKVDATGCPIAQEIKAALVLEGVNFKTNSAELEPTSIAILDKAAESLLAWPEVKVEVGGHTDSTGSAVKNRTLSQARADAVRSYLISKGVAADRMTAKGYGPDKPIADNATKEGKAKNRRVELTRTN
jgi:outer membrane protein OmpA-like peptidoglycan-associated protein